MRRLASGIVLFERAAPAMGSGACAASGASNASAAAATRLYGAATGRAAGVSRPLPAFAFEGCPAGQSAEALPTTPGAVPTVRSRPDASELETLAAVRH